MQDGQGVFRGRCTECTCQQYVRPVINRCDYCDHTPVAHEDVFYSRPSQQQQYQHLLSQQQDVMGVGGGTEQQAGGPSSSSPARSSGPINVRSITTGKKHRSQRTEQATASPVASETPPQAGNQPSWKKHTPSFKQPVQLFSDNQPLTPTSTSASSPFTTDNRIPSVSTTTQTTQSESSVEPIKPQVELASVSTDLPRTKGRRATGDPMFTISLDQEGNILQAITFMKHYCNKSFEELRAEDYDFGNKGTIEKRESLFWQLEPPSLLPTSLKESSNLPTAFVPLPLPLPSFSVSARQAEIEQRAKAKREATVKGVKTLAQQLDKVPPTDVFAIHSILYKLNAMTASYGFPSLSLLTQQPQHGSTTTTTTTKAVDGSGAALSSSGGNIPVGSQGIPAEVATTGPDAEGYFANKKYYLLGKFVSFVEDIRHEFKDISHSKSDHFDAILKHNKLESNLNAFLNSEHGGVLYFGIHDTGRVVGVKLTREHIDLVKHGVWSKMESFSPVPSPHLYHVETVPIYDRKGKQIQNLVVLEVHIVGGSNVYFNREDKAWVRRDAGNYCLKNGAELRDFIEQRKLFAKQKEESTVKRKYRKEAMSEEVKTGERQKQYKQEYDEGDGNFKMKERKPALFANRNELLGKKREKAKEKNLLEGDKPGWGVHPFGFGEGEEQEKELREESRKEKEKESYEGESMTPEVVELQKRVEELQMQLLEERKEKLKSSVLQSEEEIRFSLLPEVENDQPSRKNRRRRRKSKKGTKQKPEVVPDSLFTFEPPRDVYSGEKEDEELEDENQPAVAAEHVHDDDEIEEENEEVKEEGQSVDNQEELVPEVVVMDVEVSRRKETEDVKPVNREGMDIVQPRDAEATQIREPEQETQKPKPEELTNVGEGEVLPKRLEVEEGSEVVDTRMDDVQDVEQKQVIQEATPRKAIVEGEHMDLGEVKEEEKPKELEQANEENPIEKEEVGQQVVIEAKVQQEESDVQGVMPTGHVGGDEIVEDVHSTEGSPERTEIEQDVVRVEHVHHSEEQQAEDTKDAGLKEEEKPKESEETNEENPTQKEDVVTEVDHTEEKVLQEADSTTEALPQYALQTNHEEKEEPELNAEPERGKEEVLPSKNETVEEQMGESKKEEGKGDDDGSVGV